MNGIYNDNINLQQRAGFLWKSDGPRLVGFACLKSLQTLSLFVALLQCQRVGSSLAVLFFYTGLSSVVMLGVVDRRAFQHLLSLPKYIKAKLGIRAGLEALIVLLWFHGLILSGPVRKIVLFDLGSLWLPRVHGAFFQSREMKSKGRKVPSGAGGISIAALVALWVFDNSSLLPNGVDSFRFTGSFLSQKHEGMLCLVFASLLRFHSSGFTQKLAADGGGINRVEVLMTFICSVAFGVLGLYEKLSSSFMTVELDNPEQPPSFIYDYVLSLFVGLCLFAGNIPEYFMKSKFSRIIGVKLGISVVIVSCGFWGWAYSVPLDISFMSFLCFCALLGAGYGSMLASESAQDVQKYASSIRGTLPIYTYKSKSVENTFFAKCKTMMMAILGNYDSRQIFYFLCINLSFMFVEFIYGYLTNSLGLMSDAFHMLFDCVALAVGLFASVISKWKPDRRYSFGYGRVEVLSGYINGVFLVFISLFVFIEAIDRLLEPPEINTDKLLIVSVLGLGVNMVGMFAFSHAHTHGGSSGGSCGVGGDGRGHSHAEHGHSHDNSNMKGVFLHVLADTLGSVGVIISYFLIEYFGWSRSDPICSVFIAVLIFLSVIPLLQESLTILLQRTPEGMEHSLGSAVQRLMSMAGVVDCTSAHFWKQFGSEVIGTIHLSVEDSVTEQSLLVEANALFANVGVTDLSVQIEKVSPNQF
eukprot:Nk52_evm100s914 gene=Nk52_evmTU100s914